MPRILLFPVGKDTEVVTLPKGLKPMQDAVGGYIEQVTLEDGVGLICNEEGQLLGLEYNRVVPALQGVVCGNFFISRYNNEGETVDVTDADIKKYEKAFSRV